MVEDKFQRSNEWSEGTWSSADVSQGKRPQQEQILDDKSFMNDQLKADILRRAAELSDEEDDEDNDGQKPAAFSDVDQDGELDADGALPGPVKVLAGDEDSSDDDSEDAVKETTPQDPETILELAYIRSPKVFDRDADTRRSKARADLKAQTGWADEQIEGWRVMLERNPKKDKILQKHEFTGNRPLEGASGSGSGSQDISSNASRGRGRGRGGFRGRGRGGRGGTSGGGEGSNPEARERAWKDKNKARHANHNRKRGHDKKLARGGGGFQPS